MILQVASFQWAWPHTAPLGAAPLGVSQRRGCILTNLSSSWEEERQKHRFKSITHTDCWGVNFLIYSKKTIPNCLVYIYVINISGVYGSTGIPHLSPASFTPKLSNNDISKKTTRSIFITRWNTRPLLQRRGVTSIFSCGGRRSGQWLRHVGVCGCASITFCGRCRGTAVWLWCPLAAVPLDRSHTPRHPSLTHHLWKQTPRQVRVRQKMCNISDSSVAANAAWHVTELHGDFYSMKNHMVFYPTQSCCFSSHLCCMRV